MSLDVLVQAVEGGGNPYHKGAGPGGGQFASEGSGGVSVSKPEWVLGTDKFGMQA